MLRRSSAGSSDECDCGRMEVEARVRAREASESKSDLETWRVRVALLFDRGYIFNLYKFLLDCLPELDRPPYSLGILVLIAVSRARPLTNA